jgi:hypothetical protein
MNQNLKEYDRIFREHFGLDLQNEIVHFEIIRKKSDTDKFERIRSQYFHNLRNHSLSEQAAKKLYVGDDIIIHIQYSFSRSEVNGIKKESWFYYPICSIDEILRIENPTTGADHLLKIRADAIADHPRLIRIFLSRRERYEKDWSLTNYYSDSRFDEYVKMLPAEYATKCSKIPAGFAFLCEPNGACIRTAGGDAIFISEALNHFLYYMNVFTFGEKWGIDISDRMSSLILAVRTMLQTEAPDFDLDPRGQLPSVIHEHCAHIVEYQLKYVIGHEYAHLLLGHFDNTALTATSNAILLAHGSDFSATYYTPRQQQEFDADAGSILHANYTDVEAADVLDAATSFFLHLDLFYAFSDYINPRFGGVKTHPDPVSRIWALRKAVVSSKPELLARIYSDDHVKSAIEDVTKLKNQLVKEFLPYQIDRLEFYGSIYLPSYRIKEMHDRFDF